MTNFYRPEIDGLRTLAILPVILSHAGFNWASGGYIGVDIFFVISGYLITYLLIKEHLQTGKISIYHFYERRLRRILPALFAVLIPSSIFAYCAISPELLITYAKGLAYTLIFSSNIYFWKTSGYFDVEAENHPLLHTWSLAVEEQYYIFFPLILIAFYKIFKLEKHNFLILLLLSIGLVSFISGYKTLQTDPKSAFYLLPFRAWELMVGALCALSYTKVNSFISISKLKSIYFADIISLSGLFLIFFSIATLNENSSFPGINALSPVLGAALIISFSRGTITSKLLSYKPFVWIGLISYSLYLWHQPIFAFARIMSINELEQVVYIPLILATFLLATVSYFLVERPFRKKHKISYNNFLKVFISLTIVLTVFIGLAVVSNGFENKHPDALLNNMYIGHQDHETGVCHKKYTLPKTSNVDVCEFGSKNSTSSLILFGDSHADILLRPLNIALKQNKIKGYRILNWNCSVIPGFFKGSKKEYLKKTQICNDSQAKVLNFIERKNSVTVLSLRWTNRVAPVDGYKASVLFDNGAGGIEKSNTGDPNFVIHKKQKSFNADAKKEMIDKYLETLTSASKKLIVVTPVPEVGWNVTDYNYLYHFYNKAIPDEITTNYDLYLKRHEFVLNTLEHFKSKENVYFVNPAKQFCIAEKNSCYAQKNGTSYYSDDDHLNPRGSAILTKEIIKHIINFE